MLVCWSLLRSCMFCVPCIITKIQHNEAGWDFPAHFDLYGGHFRLLSLVIINKLNNKTIENAEMILVQKYLKHFLIFNFNFYFVFLFVKTISGSEHASFQ